MQDTNSILSRFKNFLRNEAGNYGIMFGLVLFPIIGSVALSVDYSNLSRERSAVQNSLDAAALATAKLYATGASQSELEVYAKDFFEANLPSYVDLDRVTFSYNLNSEPATDQDGNPYLEKSVGLSAVLDYDTYLARAIGHDTITSTIGSEVAMGNITVEIAIVMDNSGSMSGTSKIGLAKTTSKDLVDSIFNGAGASNKSDPVKFALVPFAASVNIDPSNKNKNWMDKKGWAPTHNENLDWKNTYVRIEGSEWQSQDKGTHYIHREKVDGSWDWKTRFDVFDMLDVDWAGCVEMRPWPHNTQDTHQMINSSFNNVKNGYSGGDGLDALFVPAFAPSEPHRWYRWSNGYYYWDYYNYSNDYLNDWTTITNNTGDDADLQTIYADGSYADPYDDGVYQSNQNLRQDWVWRYQAAYHDDDVIEKDISGSSYGPNDICTTTPIEELTTNKGAIKSAIEQMDANGNTNIQQGIAWGWRVVSSREPFTDGRSESDVDNRKYIIALTDGNNVYGSSSTPNETQYGAWGYGKHDRIEEGLDNSDRPDLYKNVSLNTYEKKMNVHTLQTCENAKADGVTIFAIAFDVSDGSSVKELLEACAGSGIMNGEEVAASGVFYYDVDGEGLTEAMAEIAAQISDMRIKQ